jgi:hypothetical protein
MRATQLAVGVCCIGTPLTKCADCFLQHEQLFPFRRNGLDKYDFDRDGYDKEGYDVSGYDK